MSTKSTKNDNNNLLELFERSMTLKNTPSSKVLNAQVQIVQIVQIVKVQIEIME